MAVYQCPYCSLPFRDHVLCQNHMEFCSNKPEETLNLKEFEKMTVVELKKLAAERNIEGFEKMKKDELLNALKGDADDVG